VSRGVRKTRHGPANLRGTPVGETVSEGDLSVEYKTQRGNKAAQRYQKGDEGVYGTAKVIKRSKKRA